MNRFKERDALVRAVEKEFRRNTGCISMRKKFRQKMVMTVAAREIIKAEKNLQAVEKTKCEDRFCCH